MIYKDKISKVIRIVLSLPKSFIFNIRVFPLHIAIKLPVLISYNTKIYGVYHGCMEFDTNHISLGMFRFGFGGTYGIQPISHKSVFEIRKPGKVILSGKAAFCESSTLRVGGVLRLGNDVSFNRYGLVSCNNKISIGNDFLAGWSVRIRDTDNHRIWHNGTEESTVHEVLIGEHVWICANVDIIKGTIMNDTVVSMNSLVNREFSESNVLIAGTPARIVKHDIHWERR